MFECERIDTSLKTLGDILDNVKPTRAERYELRLNLEKLKRLRQVKNYRELFKQFFDCDYDDNNIIDVVAKEVLKEVIKIKKD